jgi:hypothetical protein
LSNKFIEIEAKLAEAPLSIAAASIPALSVAGSSAKNSVFGVKDIKIDDTYSNHIPLRPIMEENIEFDRLSQASIENLNNHINGDLNDSGLMEEEVGPK